MGGCLKKSEKEDLSSQQFVEFSPPDRQTYKSFKISPGKSEERNSPSTIYNPQNNHQDSSIQTSEEAKSELNSLQQDANPSKTIQTSYDSPPVMNLQQLLEQIKTAGLRILELGRKVKFRWQSVVEGEEFAEFCKFLKANFSTLRENYQVKLRNKENYYLHYQTTDFKIMEIGMKAEEQYPIHDHPEMLVVSLVLKGKVKFDTGELQLKEEDRHPFVPFVGQRIAYKTTGTQVLEEGSMTYLHADYRNLHELHMLEDSVVFDILINDYDSHRKMSVFRKVSSTEVEILEIY